MIDNPIPWPDGNRCAVAYTYDMDADSILHLAYHQDAGNRVMTMSMLRYGPEIAIPRILKMYADHGLRQTFFLPAWCMERYPATVEAILKGGHEIGHHGYIHEHPNELSREEEHRMLNRSIEVIEAMTGARPRGYRAPSYRFSQHTLDLLLEEGFDYDSSLMGDDIPYLLDNGHGTVVELPSHYAMDDWPHYMMSRDLQYMMTIKSPQMANEVYRAEFDAAWRFGGLWIAVWHPFLSGRLARAAATAELIEYMQGKGGVWFATLAEISAHVRKVIADGTWTPQGRPAAGLSRPDPRDRRAQGAMSDRDTLAGWLDDDRDRLIGFLADFLRADSPNPPGDTLKAARHVIGFLEAGDLDHRIIAPQPTMPNIVAAFDGAKPGRHLVLNGHMDVFPVAAHETWRHGPWSGDIAEGCVWGRGAVDMKCGTTASIFAYAYLARLKERLKGRLTLTVVSDEETFGPWGARYLMQHHPEVHGDCCLSGEPSDPSTVRFGERGLLWLKFEVATAGGHSAYPHTSASAAKIAVALMADLRALEEMDVAAPGNVGAVLDRSGPAMERALGAGASDVIQRVSVNFGVVQAGVKINMIPGRATIECDLRLPIGLDKADLMARVDAIVARHEGARVEELNFSPPNWCDPDHAMVGILQRNAEELDGRGAEPAHRPGRHRHAPVAPGRRPGLRLRPVAPHHGRARRARGDRGVPPHRAHPHAERLRLPDGGMRGASAFVPACARRVQGLSPRLHPQAVVVNFDTSSEGCTKLGSFRRGWVRGSAAAAGPAVGGCLLPKHSEKERL